MYLNFILFLVFQNYVASRDIPAYVNLCDKTDPEVAQCFINTVYELKPHLVEGIPEMNIPSIDPFYIESITLDSTNSESVKIIILLSDLILEGFKDMEFKNHTMDFENVHFYAIMKIPTLHIFGQYKANGKVLLAEIDTTGHVDINATGIVFEGHWLGRYYTKKDKEHINIDKIDVTELDIDHADIKFDDVFDDAQISKTFNGFVNENLQSLLNDLKPVIKETIGELLKDYFNRVYKLFPVEKLYPKK